MSWWRDAVVYAVDLRSFCDGDSDGVGDLDGVRSRLGYLELLDVDAIALGPAAVCGPDPAPAGPDSPRAPLDWAEAADQLEDAGSGLSLYRHAIELRRRHPGFTAFAGEDRLEWFGAPEGCLAFRRAGSTLVCALNTSPVPVPLPPGDVLLSSRPTSDGELPAHSAAWLA